MGIKDTIKPRDLSIKITIKDNISMVNTLLSKSKQANELLINACFSIKGLIKTFMSNSDIHIEVLFLILIKLPLKRVYFIKFKHNNNLLVRSTRS